jgi:hypothetical protein
VVYEYVSSMESYLSVDLCGSSYDTKVYIYDANFTLLACNDDYWYDSTCGYYTSRLEGIAVEGIVYIVVDGYYGAYGNYIIQVGTVCCDPQLDCPVGGVPEGEPAIVDDYLDLWNGGCNSPPDHPFQEIQPEPGSSSTILCGVSGWYLFDGADFRDTDWFLLTMGPERIEITADAEQESYLFELGPQDCDNVAVVQMVTVGAMEPGAMVIDGYDPGAAVWFWVGPTDWSMGEDYDYVVWFSGLMPTVRTSASESWSTIKALFE